MAPNQLTKSFLDVLLLENFFGIFIYIFIIIVICVDNRKRRETKASDVVVVALAISCLCNASGLSFNILSNYIWPNTYISVYITYSMYFLTLYSNTSCVWLDACLCFYYFSKITTFGCGALRWLKLKIDSVLYWMILASEIVSILSSFTMFIPLIESNSVMGGNASNNLTYDTYVPAGNIPLIFLCIPTLIIIITTALSMASLYLHAEKMVKNIVTTINGNIGTYRNIVRCMFCLLLFYVAFYVSLLLQVFDVFTIYGEGYWVTSIVLLSFAPVQSIFLILVTPKLKKAWICVFNIIKEKLSVCLNIGLQTIVPE